MGAGCQVVSIAEDVSAWGPAVVETAAVEVEIAVVVIGLDPS